MDDAVHGHAANLEVDVEALSLLAALQHDPRLVRRHMVDHGDEARGARRDAMATGRQVLDAIAAVGPGVDASRVQAEVRVPAAEVAGDHHLGRLHTHLGGWVGTVDDDATRDRGCARSRQEEGGGANGREDRRVRGRRGELRGSDPASAQRRATEQRQQGEGASPEHEFAASLRAPSFAYRLVRVGESSACNSFLPHPYKARRRA